MRSDAVRNRARILEVARDLVRRDGPGASMDDIAAGAGVAVGTLYRHFPTKAALVEEVIRDSVAQLADGAEAAVHRVDQGASAGDELELLFRLVAERYSVDAAVKEAAATLGAQAPGVGGVFSLEPGSAELRAWQAVERLLAAAAREGTVRPDLTPADLLAVVTGIPRDPVAPEVRERYIEIILAGIRPT